MSNPTDKILSMARASAQRQWGDAGWAQLTSDMRLAYVARAVLAALAQQETEDPRLQLWIDRASAALSGVES